MFDVASKLTNITYTVYATTIVDGEVLFLIYCENGDFYYGWQMVAFHFLSQ